MPRERRLTGHKTAPQAQGVGSPTRPIGFDLEHTQLWNETIASMPRPANAGDTRDLSEYVIGTIRLRRIDDTLSVEGLTVPSRYFGTRSHPLLKDRHKVAKQAADSGFALGLGEYARRKVEPEPDPFTWGWPVEGLLGEKDLPFVPEGFASAAPDDPGPGTSDDERKLLRTAPPKLRKRLLKALRWRAWRLYDEATCIREVAEAIEAIEAGTAGKPARTSEVKAK